MTTELDADLFSVIGSDQNEFALPREQFRGSVFFRLFLMATAVVAQRTESRCAGALFAPVRGLGSVYDWEEVLGKAALFCGDGSSIIPRVQSPVFADDAGASGAIAIP